VPTVTIFGPTNPYNWTPPDNSLHRFLQYDPGCKITCDTSECKEYQCITGISEYKYLTEIEDLIRYMRIK
jgi:ADP-heptose:LPS heptosyltransferase